MSYEQSDRVRKHIGLVDLHLRRRVPTPRTPHRLREREDLFQEGCLGLIRAAVSYDAKRDGDFPPYALMRIRGAVHTALHEHFSTIRIPTGELNRNKRVMKMMHKSDSDRRNDPAHVRCIESPNSVLEAQDRRRRHDDALPHPEHGTVGEHVREKFMLSLTEAATRMAEKCRRPDAAEVMHLLANERVAASDPGRCTTLRSIGERFGISAGRLVNWQQSLERMLKAMLATDEELALLDQVHSSDKAGLRQPVDSMLAADLERLRHRMIRRIRNAGNLSGEQLLLTVLKHAGIDPGEHAERMFADLEATAQRRILAAVQP